MGIHTILIRAITAVRNTTNGEKCVGNNKHENVNREIWFLQTIKI